MTSATGAGEPAHDRATHPRPAPARRALPPVLLGAAIFLVALNLRTPIAAVPPLAERIDAELGLSGVTLGLLTTLPVLCMGLLAPGAQRLGHRIGREAAVTVALALLLAGSLLRLGGGAVPLYGGTLVIGAGIALAGTLLPGIVKEFFPDRAGLMTGVYMFAMMLGAVVGSGAAVPLAGALGSWQATLAAVAVPVVVGLAAWVPVQRAVNDHDDPPGDPAPSGGLPWRSAAAWVVAGYLSLQSVLFYSQLAWIPPFYVDSGSTEAQAGALLAAFSASQLAAGLLAPALADRFADRRPLLVGAVSLTVLGMLGLLAPGTVPVVTMLVLGLGLGAGFALGLVFLVSYAASPAASGRLSAMAFLVSYTVAALGPSGFGLARDLSGGYTVPWALLLVVAVAQLAVVRLMGPGRRVL